jgi:hypothetical protein
MCLQSFQTVWIKHNAAWDALAAGRTGRTGAVLRLPAGATTSVGRHAALVASLGHDLLVVVESQQFGLSKAQSRTGGGVRRGHGRPERTIERLVEVTNLEGLADELRQVPVVVKRHIAMLRADRFGEAVKSGARHTRQRTSCEIWQSG